MHLVPNFPVWSRILYYTFLQHSFFQNYIYVYDDWIEVRHLGWQGALIFLLTMQPQLSAQTLQQTASQEAETTQTQLSQN